MEQRLPLARQLIEAGTLPATSNVRSFGGRGSGSRCALCGGPISTSGVEIEIVYVGPPQTSAILHPDCNAIWLLAVREQKP
jgi:hypothetical protein